MKKLISFVLALVLSVGIVSAPAYAVSPEVSTTGNAADISDFIVAEYSVAESSDASISDDILANTPTNGDGQIDHIIVLNADLMSRTSYTNIEVPANTVIYITSVYLTGITMSVNYMPSNLTLYYGISIYNNGTGNHWANSATGGSGSATITPGITRYYYLYLANGNSKVMYVNLTYDAYASLKGFLSGFELVIPEEWAKMDSEFDITIDSQKQDPGVLIPWGKKDNTPSIIPIPDDTKAGNDITIVPIE